MVWAGPHSTQLLAEWGAEVIRVEPLNRIHPNTRGAEVGLTKEQCEEQARDGSNLAALYPYLDPEGRPLEPLGQPSTPTPATRSR